MKRKSLNKAKCPIARSLDEIGDWWSLLIVRDVFVGKRRFGELQTCLGVAKNILTVRLKKLVHHGVLKLVPAADGSAYQEYALTDKGRDLLIVLLALRQWGEEQLCKTCEVEIVDAQKGQPVHVELRSRDGRPLKLGDVRFVPAKA